jgi:hypothetical protein
MIQYYKGKMNMRDAVLPYVKKIELHHIKKISEHLLKKIVQCRNATSFLTDQVNTTIPKEIFNLSLLTYLKISHSNLKQLPKEICKLTQLKFLDISNSKIEIILPGIGNLSHLECLIMGKNDISDFPTDFFDLSGLRYLDMNNNKFLELSEGMGYLTSLIGLNISGNKIEYLFDSIDNLVHLEQINLMSTCIKTLPYSFCEISINCELIIDSLSLMDNLPHNLQYLTVYYKSGYASYHSKAKFTNLPPTLQILYIRGHIDIANSKSGLNTRIIPYDSSDHSYRYSLDYESDYIITRPDHETPRSYYIEDDGNQNFSNNYDNATLSCWYR